MSFNRTCLLYLYLALTMVLCFFLGNVAAHSQNAATPNQSASPKPPFVDAQKSRYLDRYSGVGSSSTYMPLVIPQETERYPLTNYFATGDAFYLDRDSFEATSDGKINYKIVGKNLLKTDGEDIPTQESTNQVDCQKGTFLSQTSRKQLDKQGNVISQDTFANVQPITLAPGSSLYSLLKDACQEHFATPGNPLPWVK